MKLLAYLDPGSGSLFFQLLAGGLAGVATIFVVLRRKFASLFRFGRRAQEVQASDDDV